MRLWSTVFLFKNFAKKVRQTNLKLWNLYLYYLCWTICIAHSPPSLLDIIEVECCISLRNPQQRSQKTGFINSMKKEFSTLMFFVFSYLVLVHLHLSLYLHTWTYFHHVLFVYPGLPSLTLIFLPTFCYVDDIFLI